jgi:hypothetical protein
VLLVLRGLWHQYRPQRRGESTDQWLARRHPSFIPPRPHTDGTD